MVLLGAASESIGQPACSESAFASALAAGPSKSHGCSPYVSQQLLPANMYTGKCPECQAMRLRGSSSCCTATCSLQLGALLQVTACLDKLVFDKAGCAPHPEPPPQFMCPITLQLMKDPVVASDSQTCMPHTIHFAHCHVGVRAYVSLQSGVPLLTLSS